MAENKEYWKNQVKIPITLGQAKRLIDDSKGFDFKKLERVCGLINEFELFGTLSVARLEAVLVFLLAESTFVPPLLGHIYGFDDVLAVKVEDDEDIIDDRHGINLNTALRILTDGKHKFNISLEEGFADSVEVKTITDICIIQALIVLLTQRIKVGGGKVVHAEELIASMNWEEAEIKAEEMHWMREDIFRVCEAAGMVRMHACCGVPDKLCNDDKWEGNMESLFKHIEAEVRKKVMKENNAR